MPGEASSESLRSETRRTNEAWCTRYSGMVYPALRIRYGVPGTPNSKIRTSFVTMKGSPGPEEQEDEGGGFRNRRACNRVDALSSVELDDLCVGIGPEIDDRLPVAAIQGSDTSEDGVRTRYRDVGEPVILRCEREAEVIQKGAPSSRLHGRVGANSARQVDATAGVDVIDHRAVVQKGDGGELLGGEDRIETGERHGIIRGHRDIEARGGQGVQDDWGVVA